MFSSFRTLRWIFLFCCGGIALADWLFYAQPAGGNLFAFHAFLVVLALLQAPFKREWKPTAAILTALTGLLLAMVAQPGPLIFAMFWLCLLAFVFTTRHGWSTNTVEWLARWFHFGFTCGFVFLRDCVSVIRWRNSGHGSSSWKRSGKALQRWVLPVAGSAVFLILFSVANPVLSFWFSEFESSLESLLYSLAVSPPRIFFWGFVGVILWALFRTRYKRRNFPEPGPGKMLSASLLVRCLALFNVVFLIQTALDVIYLWGGASLPHGMTYAEYAHRGAYPLIATTLLAGAFVLATFRAGMPTHETTIARRLVYVWLAQNSLLTISSLWRLHLYVEVYSLTALRVAAAIWMLLVFSGLMLVLLRIYAGKSNAWLLNANFINLLLILYTCCFVNFDAIISNYNVRHSKEVSGEGVLLDIRYLEQIGPEAIPALLWFQRNSSNQTKAMEAQIAAMRLIQHLNTDWNNWRSWTLRKYALRVTSNEVTSNQVSRKTRHPELITRY